jgi:NADPH-dependent 2,4-dienoyl-CoA reductase/sulfur reductase-like enzyme/peroxiredoxin family protein/TusA-related sulfurtransferase/rhodanese-related sulfurtransferase
MIMTNNVLQIVIVGGVAAGASAAARARRLSEKARITIIERGSDVSFANCGLPYHIGGEIADRARLSVQTPEGLAALLNLDVRTRTEAVFIDRARKTLRVRPTGGGTEEMLSYDKLILAPGASPLRPSLPGIDDPRIHTLRSLEDMDRIKIAAGAARSALVIGAGFIGLEMAEQLHRIGKSVTLVEKVGHVLPHMDPEMVSTVESELRAHGVTLILGDGLAGFTNTTNGVTTLLESGRTLSADLIILSIGVRPEGALAGAAGLSLNDRGAIRVNAWMQTDDPDIYAAGDAVESKDRLCGTPMNLPLGGPANRQGRLIADHIFTPELARPYPGHLGTAIVRVFDSVAGATGWTEKRLRQQGVPFEVATVTDHQHAGYFPGAVPITVKILWNPENGRLLGGQVFGVDGVDKRLDVLATALAGRLTVDDLTELELAYAPPFGSARDVVNTAGFAAQNQRRGLVSTVREIPHDRRLLDVRPAALTAIDPLPGSLNIPLDELRRRIGEIDPSARWATLCALGKMSYFAARILTQHGVDAVGVNGGLKICRPTTTPPAMTPRPLLIAPPMTEAVVELDCTGMSCPGPLLRVKASMDSLTPGQTLMVRSSDPGFARDIESFCRSSGHEFLGMNREKGILIAHLQKSSGVLEPMSGGASSEDRRKGATVVVFSGEMDKVMAALIIANGAAALGGKVTLFFTFWGINALRREQAVPVRGKSLLDQMFGWMLPRGLGALPLSRMHFAGAGHRMMKYQMASKNLPNLPDLLSAALKGGVQIAACTMAMDAMGIRAEELIDGVELGGVADYLESAEMAGTNLFV